jgi:hypothetical protein
MRRSGKTQEKNQQVKTKKGEGTLLLASLLLAHIDAQGLRAEIGDDIYFDHGANNNLKITVGSAIRFRRFALPRLKLLGAAGA